MGGFTAYKIKLNNARNKKIIPLNRKLPSFERMSSYHDIFYTNTDNELLNKKKQKIKEHLNNCKNNKICKISMQVYTIKLFHGITCRKDSCMFPKCENLKTEINKIYNHYNKPKQINANIYSTSLMINKDEFISKYLLQNINKVDEKINIINYMNNSTDTNLKDCTKKS